MALDGHGEIGFLGFSMYLVFDADGGNVDGFAENDRGCLAVVFKAQPSAEPRAQQDKTRKL